MTLDNTIHMDKVATRIGANNQDRRRCPVRTIDQDKRSQHNECRSDPRKEATDQMLQVSEDGAHDERLPSPFQYQKHDV